MTNFREKFPYKCNEQDNRIGILEQRVEMLEDDIHRLLSISIDMLAIIKKLKNTTR